MNNTVSRTGGRAPFAARSVLALAVLAGAMGTAQAQQTSNWRFYAGAGFASNGDEIGSGQIINRTNGNVVPFTIRPAGEWQFRVGADYRLAERFTLQGSVGYVDNSPMGDNGSLTFTTIPVEVMGFFNLTDALRFGFGARKSSADLKGTGVAAYGPALGSYSGSVGSVVELQYLWARGNDRWAFQGTQFGVSLRRVNESFTHNGISFSGNHYELGVALYY